MTELDKLEEYLKATGKRYSRIDKNYDDLDCDRHQIYGLDENGIVKWDAICQKGSLGYRHGLLEIYGEIVEPEENDGFILGHLSADDVIKRLNKKYGGN